jgi:hypothetical protein
LFTRFSPSFAGIRAEAEALPLAGGLSDQTVAAN